MKKIDLSIYKEEWEISLSSFFLPKKHIRRDFSERRILMEKEKETFLYEEREQKLKDQQMYMNLMREHPEEVREIYIEDPTIPSPDSSYKAGKMQEQKESDSMDDIKVSYIDPPDFVQKKDNLNESDSFYNTTSSFNESYIRNSREMDAQKEWNEKMQERKDYSINNQDKEEIISPVKELLEEQDSQHKTETDNVMKGKNSQKESNSVPSSASSSFNESNLRNSREIDAQKEWEQKMKERSQTDKEEKEEPVFQTEDLIEKRDEMQEKEIDNALKMSLTNVMRYQTNSMSKILASQKNTIKNGKDFLWRTSGAQTDTGRGIKETEANVLPFVQMAVDTTKRTLAASIAGNMHTDKELQKAYECLKARTGETNTLFSVDTTKALTTEDIKKLQKGLRKYLRDNNIGTFSNKPEIMQLELNRAIKSGRISIDEGNAIKILNKKIGEIQSLSGKSNLHHLLRFGRRKLHKYGRQESTINALFMTGALLRHTENIIRNLITIAKNAKFLVKNTVKIANLAAAKAAVKLSKTKLAKKIKEKMPERVKKKQAERRKKKQEYRKKKERKKQKRRKRKDIIDKVIDKIPHPARFVKNKIQRAKSSLVSFITRGKYNPLRFLGRIFHTATKVKNILIMGVSFILLIYFIILVILLFMTSAGAKYSLESNENKVNEFCLKKIETLYKEQQKSLASYNENGAYRHVKIKKVDKKSNSMYNSDLDFTETTNTAEMLAMAQVYFDFDLDDANENDISTYLSGLYSGSHTMDIKEMDHYTTDEDGNKVLDYTDAEITVTTYYFDDLFDCVLGSSGMYGSESPMAGQAIDIPQTYKQMWTVTEYDKFHWVSDCGKLFKMWKAAGATWDDGFACINIGGKTYRFIAVLEKFGKVGDYMTVQLDNGQNINCIVADTKRASECPNGWGHISGGSLSVVEWEVSQSYFGRYGNPGGGYGKELKGRKVARLINGGSYFKNQSGPSFLSSGTTTTGNTVSATQFLSYLDTYSAYIKQNHPYFRRSNYKNAGTFASAKSKVADGDKVNVNCVSPTMWALKEMGLLAQGTNFYSTTDGRWHGMNEKIKQKVTIISNGDLIGMNVTKAAKKGLLQAGDIIANSSFNHTYVYAGYQNGEILVYEAGGNASGKGYGNIGCGPFSAGQYKNLNIKSVFRWR